MYMNIGMHQLWTYRDDSCRGAEFLDMHVQEIY